MERVRDTQLPLAHMGYFSPLPLLEEESASLFREITASLSERKMLKEESDGIWRKSVPLWGCAETPQPQPSKRISRARQ